MRPALVSKVRMSEGAFERIVANAAHIKNVPGRKTNVDEGSHGRGSIRGSGRERPFQRRSVVLPIRSIR